MSNTNIFEVAVRNKYRFQFKGILSVEDLFDLPVESLDAIYKNLNAQLKQTQEESLLNKKSKEDKELELKIEIVKYIVTEKLKEKEDRVKQAEDKAKKQQILEIIETKKAQKLQDMSVEELEALLKEDK